MPRPEPGAGAGLKTGAAPKGSGIFVVDVDSWEALEEFHATHDIPDTFTVETGRGVQLYFEHPGFPVRNSAGDLAAEVDIRGDGGFVVAPGSPHKNGKTYTVISDLPPAPAPAWLLEWLRARPAASSTQVYPGDVTEPVERARRRELYAKYLRDDAPPRGPERRGKGDATLFDVVQRGAYDLALPVDDVLELVRRHYDPRCSPMWGDELPERVLHKAKDAKTRSTRPRIEPLPADVEAFLLEMPTIPPEGLPDAGPTRATRGTGIVWGSWEEPVDPPQYLVRGLIPISTVGMFVAMGSSLKTWTALDVGLSVAQGTPWLGRFETRPGVALVIDYESGLYELRRRVHVLHGAGVGERFGAWAYPQERIDDLEFWKRLAGAADWEKLGGGLVIVDSLAAGAPGVDENDPRVAMPMKYAARFTEGTSAGVLFIHHARKDDGDDRKMVRGSTAIYADCDWAYKFENIDETREYRRMHMVCIKPCMGPKPAPVHLELTDAAGLQWFNEDEGRAALAKGDQTPEAVRAAIRLALQGGLKTGDGDEIARSLGIQAAKVRPQIKAMLFDGEISRVPKIGFVLEDEASRKGRVLAALADGKRWKTLAEIGRAVGVPTADVEAMHRDGVICWSAEGSWKAVKR